MSTHTHTLAGFINRRISIIYLIVLAISAPLIYYISVAQLEKEGISELRNMVDAIDQIKPHARGDTTDADSGLPLLITQFLNVHKNYFYRYVGVDSLGNSQSPYTEHNQMLMDQFSGDSSLREAVGNFSHEDGQLLYIAYPTRSILGLDGFILYGVKLSGFDGRIIERVLTFIGMMTILYAIIISSINTTLRSHVINPLLRINNRTKAVAKGEIDKVFESDRKDEIGELINAIELLRRSLSMSMELLRKKPQA